MELIKAARRHNLWSDVLYIVLNLGLVVALYWLVRLFDPPYLAVGLLLLSKWRVFAVRPRYWFVHLQSNLVDIVVGLSFVALLYLGQGETGLQILLSGLYGAWLLLLKSRTRRHYVVWQAGVAQFAGLLAVSSFSYLLPSSLFVLAVWLIGYGAARHVLNAYDEEGATLPALAWGLVLAEIGWLYYHWMVAYLFVGSLAISQLSIVGLLAGFVAQRLYDIFKHRGSVRFKEARGPILFLVLLLLLIFIRFTPWNIAL
ncbi:MAG: hypothetical protein EOT04_00260 [Candidatus Chaera renei]|uniref:Uncharacterized protein n=1 Tax=Candidatus Chaera renei TaxID=2506947 RepID=A0A4Q0AK72_9BACT|nr:MAG: hypothetical protein EOT04_00260 [Candidatus Chaera renei]